jgi:hypothetical protein
MKISLLPVALIVLSAAARADDLGSQVAAQKTAAGGQVAQQKELQRTTVQQLRAAPLRVGQAGPAQFAKGVMTNSASWLKQTPAIVQYINENGCAVKDGKYAAVKMSCPAAADGTPGACVDFGRIVDEVAKNTEVVYVDMATMKALTGNPKAMAFGVTKELKKELRNPANPDQPIILGAANTIALRGDPVDPSQKAPEDGIFALVLAHEFLHIALRQVDNAALGGGARKSEADPAIANLHHRLTDGLGWKAVSWGQSDQPWKPEGPDKGCAKAGQAAP